MSLSVQFLGMTLKNPVIVAAGPWSCDAAAIQKSIDAGAAAARLSAPLPAWRKFVQHHAVFHHRS